MIFDHEVMKKDFGEVFGNPHIIEQSQDSECSRLKNFMQPH